MQIFIFQQKKRIPKKTRRRGNPAGEFWPLVLGVRWFESHGLALVFSVVGSNPAQPTVVLFLHFAARYMSRSGFLLFSRKQLMGKRPVVRLRRPDSKLAEELCSGGSRCTPRARLQRRILELQELYPHESSRLERTLSVAPSQRHQVRRPWAAGARAALAALLKDRIFCHSAKRRFLVVFQF